MSLKKIVPVVALAVLLVVLIIAQRKMGRSLPQNGTPNAANPSQSNVANGQLGTSSESQGAKGSSGSEGPALPNGMSAQNSGAKSGSDKNASAPKVAVVEGPSCFKVSFKHENMHGDPAHADEEACSHHRNLVRLGHDHINPGSLCVRVNGTPVKFQKSPETPDGIVIGAIAGPHAVITAQFCVGKHSCSNVVKNCKIPRDEFLDAIGGTEAQAAEANGLVGHWDSGDAETAKKDQALNDRVETEVKRTLAEAPESAGGVAEDGTYLFKQWIAEETPVTSCE